MTLFRSMMTRGSGDEGRSDAHTSPTSSAPRRARRQTRRITRPLAAGSAALLTVALLPFTTGAASATVGPVGDGFTITSGDLAFILKQIKIAERHSRSIQGLQPLQGPNPDPVHDPDYCSALVGPNADQIPDRLTTYGLRTVDGACNNLFPQRARSAAADEPFPRLTSPRFRDADPLAAPFPVPATGTNTYKSKTAHNVVVDEQPRLISNLIVDQTSTNPAAVAAAQFPVRTQGNPGVVPCTVDPTPADPNGTPDNCVPAHQTLFIPNVTTDVGLSPPYNSLFTFFGQFFDHGVDQTVKSGGSVFVPLRADDPLITVGADGKPNTGDEVPASQAFMVITRAQNQPGPDGILGTGDDITDANNTDTPWVDQSQTYTSHSSHQVFLREYEMNSANHPVPTGKLLGGLVADDDLADPKCATQVCYNDGNATTGSISTWASTKKQAAEKLGLLLSDMDVVNIPMLATDPYGNFIPAANGLPQYVTKGPDGKAGTPDDQLVPGDLGTPVPVPADVVHFDTPFLTDIAHNADPTALFDSNGDHIPDKLPTPDTNLTASADFAHQDPGTYDDEMLNDHFTCGDGRCNENIALSTVHQVFHHEHDRLVDYIKNVLTTDASATGLAALPDWQLPTLESPDGWNGSRLFQAARFITEMEYQHLVFEEFARKIQPAVRPFHVYSPDINSAIPAEFAHAVYRFGHSMLNDDVARLNVAPTGTQKRDNSLPLLTAFLNPPAYFDSGDASAPYSPEQAAGAVVMGSADQTGNELDEFVVETLRNNLLGLPLDLPTLNMTRARDAGIPPLNDVRRQIFAQTNDGQLAPYTSWSDFGQHLKHPESLINFVAAYGTHPTIRDSGPDDTLGTADDVTTVAAKRAAATLIVDPANPTDPAIPTDAADFMFSTGAWASGGNGVTTTGLDGVDLWVGGLAEITNLFGGLLGSTFNYVFQSALENLQDGDRFYYLARTPGMNLRTQLEGNSFSELITRNTDNTNSLKADAFATSDCKFQLGDLTFPAPSGAFITGAGSVADDPNTTDCDENRLLLRQPNGTIQYRQFNTVDPSGINGQSVYNGTDGVDRIFGGNDNDTFWGGKGNDIIEGNGGDDVALGGEGNDIITDLGGADVPKGGPGNDAIDAGIGDDIPMGNDGKDFINGGANDNETFAGPGDDFVIAGLGADAVFGDGGDDWIQGGSGQDLLQGDHGAPFFDDPAEDAPGNDIFVGQVGENDYDAEGGDDVMAQNAAVDRNAGGGGFDWAFHQYNTVPAADDLMINNNLGGLPIQVIVNRDRWQETEADSGSKFNDVILGQDGALSNPRLVGGTGFTGCDAIDVAGMNRVKGLSEILPAPTTWQGTAGEVAALAASGRCPLGPLPTSPVWGEGDILLGGPGSDTITGRSGDEIIDGDRELKVAISVRKDPSNPATEVGRTDLMEGKAVAGGTFDVTFVDGDPLHPDRTVGMTLQQAVFAGLVDPGNLVGVREIADQDPNPSDCGATTPLNCDTAAYAGPRSQYTITANANGSITVTDTTSAPVAPGVAAVGDGSDTLFNVERLSFTDGTFAVQPPLAPVISTAVAGIASATVNFGLNTTLGAPAVTSFSLLASANGGAFTLVASGISRTAVSRTITGLIPGTSYTFQVVAVNEFGSSAPSATSDVVVPLAAPIPPSAPTGVSAAAGNGSATVSWIAPAPNGGPAISSFEIVTTPATVATITGIPSGSTSLVVTGLTNGTAYTFQVRAVNAGGPGPLSTASAAVTPVAPVAPVAPSAPTAVSAVRGDGSATVTWTDGANGGSPITGYQVQTLRNGGLVKTDTLAAGPQTSTVITGLANGTTYTFRVRAVNAIGLGVLSAATNAVTPATVPAAPGIGTAVSGTAGAPVTATARWNRPANNGGSAITAYRVSALRFNAAGVLQSTTVFTAGANVRTLQMTLAAGTYRFQVRAVNAIGVSGLSARSNLVTAR